jgi:Mitochondrial carrier protein
MIQSTSLSSSSSSSSSSLRTPYCRQHQKQRPNLVSSLFCIAITWLVSSSSSSSSSHRSSTSTNAIVVAVVEANTSPGAASAALHALQNIDYRYFVAGGTCAAFSHGITTPIDVIKTKMQANPKVCNTTTRQKRKNEA